MSCILALKKQKNKLLEAEENIYVNVILPLPVKQIFTYQLREEILGLVQVGCRVAVPFGNTKVYAAIVESIHHIKPSYELKYVMEVLDDTPIVSKANIALWQWVSKYYMCSIGEVMNAALPSSYKLANETYLVIHPNFNLNKTALTDAEFLVVEALELHQRLRVKEVAKILQLKTVLPFIKGMQDSKIIQLEDEIKEQYRSKKKRVFCLAKDVNSENAIKLLNKYRKSPKQEAFLHQFLLESQSEIDFYPFCKNHGFKTVHAKGLVEKNIIELYDVEVNRLEQFDLKIPKLKHLNEEQQKALDSFNSTDKKVSLLHGVTSSGKTEVYIHIIKKYLDAGEQVLYLVPEIALTTQLVSRLKYAFGDRVAVYHSKFGINEKAELWSDIRHNLRFPIVVGARSSVFLPFAKLGLVIVDEEHDTSFKQQDPAPRYNARDLAVYMGGHYGSKILLGTATPSLETAYNVYEQKYHLTTLKKRFGNFSFPEIQIVDIGHAYKRKKMHGHFSEQLLGSIQDTINTGQQVLLFQNRRGFAPQQQCQSCGHVPQCKYCDVSLTYHKQTHKHKCHYCGYTEKPANFCKLCNNFDVKYKGFGTEKIEDELASIFSDKVILRMDYDTTRQKGAYERLINAFEDREIDILVGTQMISKGLDFKHVGMVGVLNADQLFNFPDFRAFERAFQMLCQVSGRAGRKQEQSKVVIQAFQPEHDVLNFVKSNDYKTMLQVQLKERQTYRYPPFYRMIHILVRHRSRSTVINASDTLANALRQVFESRVLGPEFPYIERIKSLHQKQILLKIERSLSYADSKLRLNKYVNSIRSMEQFKGVKIRIDVDPF